MNYGDKYILIDITLLIVEKELPLNSRNGKALLPFSPYTFPRNSSVKDVNKQGRNWVILRGGEGIFVIERRDGLTWP